MGISEEIDSYIAEGEHMATADHVGDVVVSTVTLPFNHAYRKDQPPLYYETMIFEGKFDGWLRRYTTQDEALAGHKQAVEMVKGDPDHQAP